MNQLQKSKKGRHSSMKVEVTDALTRALFEEWAVRGLSALSLEAVARRAGVGKAALYRRWSSKLDMVENRLYAVGLTITEIDDHGSLYEDIVALLLVVRRLLRHPLLRRIVADIHAEQTRNPAVRKILEAFQLERRNRMEIVLIRAIQRGELREESNLELMKDILISPLYWREIVLQKRLHRADLYSLADALCVALKVL